MSRISPLRLLAGLLLLVVAAWLAVSLEWVEVEMQPPNLHERDTDRFALAEKLLGRLGATVTRPGNLDTLPPPGARLLLDTREWDLFEGRAARLKAWVEQGGHLVASADLLDEEELEDWLPMHWDKRAPAPETAPTTPPGTPGSTKAGTKAPAGRPRLPDCLPLTDTAAPAGRGEALSVCAPRPARQSVDLLPDPEVRPQWQMVGSAGTEMLRVPVGQGSVTLVRPWSLMAGERLLQGDNALAFARMLQAGKGTAVWLVTEETGEPLPLWIWRRATFAVLLALAALALYLWRGAVRFGPLAPPVLVQHRSIAEQVAGTGRFLQRHGAASLHAAQCRALAEAARRRVPGAGGLTDYQRLLAIARASGLDDRALADALAAAPVRRPGALPATLALLETARRRLLARRIPAPEDKQP